MTNAEADAAFMAMAQLEDISVEAGITLFSPLNVTQRDFVLRTAFSEERRLRIRRRIEKALRGEGSDV